ncbi:MAG TPA: hypothetical protein VFY45_13275 [Baekduia sp.]|nr:hypothetical protein [Baekduia sp.]
MSDHEQPTTVYEDPDMGFYDDEPQPDDTLPARSRRRLLTPVSGGLLAIVLVAGGFIGGVQVQKHQGSDNGGARNGLPAAFAARLAAGGGQAPGAAGGPGTGTARSGGGSGGATAGTVANIKGSTLYVTSADGTTVKVKTNDNSKVTRNAAGSVASVHPGDTVVIQGSTGSNGTVTASSITATAKGVTPAGFGGAFPGAAAGAGAAGTTGTAPESGGSAPQVPQGFAPPSG